MDDWKEEILQIHNNAIKYNDIEPWSLEDVRFMALALCGEVGELANLIKKQWRARPADQLLLYDKVIEEIADVAIYLELLAHGVGVKTEDCVRAKLPKIREKYNGRNP